MPEATSTFADADQFSSHLQKLRSERKRQKEKIHSKGSKRRHLSPQARDKILAKTGTQCHICGGTIDSRDWEADHVLAHASGGEHALDNFLPAHQLCNSYRWFYGAEEFQWIIKLGVWLRTKIEKQDRQALEIAERFIRKENGRVTRRKPPNASGAKSKKATAKKRAK